MKRGRENGQITKEEYEFEEEKMTQQPGSFIKADADTLAGRKRKKAKTCQQLRKEEFHASVYDLNLQFTSWAKEQFSKNPKAPIIEAARDYITYIKQLEDQYLREYGEVLTFGSGDCGQLAHGTEDQDIEVRFPRIVYSLRNKMVEKIACGGLHNIVSTTDGRIFTWGCNDDGSLGRTGEPNLPEEVQLPTEDPVILVACGDCQTFAVTLTGDVYGWGCYKDREGKKWFDGNTPKDCKKQQNTPMLISTLSEVIELACGATFNVARRTDGSVVSWGIGECGELGRKIKPMKNSSGDYDLNAIFTEQLTPGPMIEDSTNQPITGIKTIGCGSYHALLVKASGASVFSTGLNNYGQLGLGDNVNRFCLHHVESLDGSHICQITGGFHHSLAIAIDGRVFAWGRGDSGQLGIKDERTKDSGFFVPTPTEVSIPPIVISVSAGNYHNLALTNKNEVYTWGYGDMLALGHGRDKDEPIPKKINFSKLEYKKMKILQVCGGGQHSAIIAVIESMN